MTYLQIAIIKIVLTRWTTVPNGKSPHTIYLVRAAILNWQTITYPGVNPELVECIKLNMHEVDWRWNSHGHRNVKHLQRMTIQQNGWKWNPSKFWLCLFISNINILRSNQDKLTEQDSNLRPLLRANTSPKFCSSLMMTTKLIVFNLIFKALDNIGIKYPK